MHLKSFDEFGTVNKLAITLVCNGKEHTHQDDACIRRMSTNSTEVVEPRPNLLKAGEYKTPFHFALSFVLDKICGQLPHHGISNSSALKTGAQSIKVLYVSIGLACLISPMISTSFLRLSTI